MLAMARKVQIGRNFCFRCKSKAGTWNLLPDWLPSVKTERPMTFDTQGSH